MMLNRASRLIASAAVCGGVLYADFHLVGVVPSLAVQVSTAALPQHAAAASSVLGLAVRSNCAAEQVIASSTIDVVAAQLRQADTPPALRRRLLVIVDRCAAASPLTHAAILRNDIVRCWFDGQVGVGADDARLVSSLMAKLARDNVFGDRVPVQLYARGDALHQCAALLGSSPRDDDAVVADHVALTLRRLAHVKALRRAMLDDGALSLLLRVADHAPSHVAAALAELSAEAALPMARNERCVALLRALALANDAREVRLHVAETLLHVLDACAGDDALMVSVLRRVGVDVFERLVDSVDSFNLQTVLERCLARLQTHRSNVDLSRETYVVDEQFVARRRQLRTSATKHEATD